VSKTYDDVKMADRSLSSVQRGKTRMRGTQKLKLEPLKDAERSSSSLMSKIKLSVTPKYTE
jgi:hypothetical protein